MTRNAFVLFILLTHVALAQTKEKSDRLKSSLSISTGLVHVRTIDAGLASKKLKFTGNGIPVTAAFQLESPRQHTTLTLNFYNAKLSNESANLPVSFQHGFVSLSHSRMVHSFAVASKPVTLFAGLQAASDINFFQSPSLDNDDVLVINSLHVLLRSGVTLTESSTLHLSVSLPTVSLSKRLVLDGGLHEPASTEDKTMQVLYHNSKFMFANTYSFNATYRRMLSSYTAWIVVFNFNYITNDTQALVRLYTNALETGLRFNFKK